MGIVADQTAWQVNLVHHVVAGINAEGTGNAFKLQPVADINAHRTDGNALVAINAMTAVIPRLPFLVRSARLSPRRVLGAGPGVLIHHRPLKLGRAARTGM